MLCYRSANLNLVTYSKVDWGGDLNKHKYSSGYAFLLNGGVISSSNKKQSCIALSTMKAEFITCSAATQKVVWLRRFLPNLIVTTRAKDPMTIHYDSTMTIVFMKDPKYHGRTKHIDMCNSFIRDLITCKTLEFMKLDMISKIKV